MQVEYYSRDCVDIVGGEIYGKESCILEAASVWVAFGYW